MSIVEIWVAGIQAPFRLEFRHMEDALHVKNNIGLYTTDPESFGQDGGPPWKDDFGQQLEFKRSALLALRVTEA